MANFSFKGSFEEGIGNQELMMFVGLWRRGFSWFNWKL